jgi:molecular chaperone DnaK
MVKEAESHAEEDKAKKKTAEAKNNANSLIFSTEKSLTEHGDKISEDEKKAIESAISDLKSALEGDKIDIEAVEAKTEILTQAAMKLGEALYKAAQADASEAGNNNTSSDEDNVVDAEFEEVKDDNNSKKNGTKG